MTQKIVEREEGALQEQSPMIEIIRIAVEKGNLDQLEKLLALKEREEANKARKAYHAAMAAFKANPPKIDKDQKVSFATSVGKTSYNHASLANVTEKISTELSKYGLSASWTTKQNGAIQVTCRITHIQGHSEETTLSAPSDTSGSKNAIQAIGSTITYLERYTLLALTGLATFDQDDDGRATGALVELIGEKEISQIVDYFSDIGPKFKQAKFLAYMKAQKVEDILKSDFKKAVTVLEQVRKEKAGKK